MRPMLPAAVLVRSVFLFAMPASADQIAIGTLAFQQMVSPLSMPGANGFETANFAGDFSCIDFPVASVPAFTNLQLTLNLASVWPLPEHPAEKTAPGALLRDARRALLGPVVRLEL